MSVLQTRTRLGSLLAALVLLFAMVAGATAQAAYYVQGGTCSGTYSNWRGDYTTGYAYFAKTYSSDSDCDLGIVDIYNGGTWRAGASDSVGTISAIASTLLSVTTSRHQLCWNPPNYSCHTGHWLNF